MRETHVPVLFISVFFSGGYGASMPAHLNVAVQGEPNVQTEVAGQWPYTSADTALSASAASACPCSLCAPPPCIDFYPDHPITEAELRKANYEAFVKQVVRDEDQRIAKNANNMVQRLVQVQQAALAKKAYLESVRQQSKLRSTAARKKAEDELSKKFAEVVKGVTEQATLAGRRAQLADDQAAITQALAQRAEASKAKAQTDKERADFEKQQVVAQQEATKSVLEALRKRAATAQKVQLTASTMMQNAQASELNSEDLSATLRNAVQQTTAAQDFQGMAAEAVRDALQAQEATEAAEADEAASSKPAAGSS